MSVERECAEPGSEAGPHEQHIERFHPVHAPRFLGHTLYKVASKFKRKSGSAALFVK